MTVGHFGVPTLGSVDPQWRADVPVSTVVVPWAQPATGRKGRGRKREREREKKRTERERVNLLLADPTRKPKPENPTLRQ